MSTEFSLRNASESDRTYLARLFYLTDVWGDETKEPSDHLIDDFSLYLDPWTPDQGGIIALSPKGVPAGGTWLRAGEDRRPPAGFVSPDVPELAISVERAFAGHQLGGKLIDAALSLARDNGHPGVSLAVDDGNDRAFRLYEKKGFETVEVRPDLGVTAMIHRF